VAVPGARGLSRSTLSFGLDLEADVLAAVAPSSARTYRDALRLTAAWAGCPLAALPDALIGLGRREATRLARRYRSALLERGCAPATVNVALNALRLVVRTARTLDVIDWTLDVPSVRTQPYRDTRGPGLDGIRAMLAATTRSRSEWRRVRDRVAIAVLASLAIRRNELTSLSLEDVERDLTGVPSALWVLPKGGRQRQRVALPQTTAAELSAWLAVRGPTPGRLFRLGNRGLAAMIARVAARGGIRHTHPHAIRHTSISEALERTGDVRRVMAEHSRHANIACLMRYDDNRRAATGAVAAMVADALGGQSAHAPQASAAVRAPG
jgi:integrase/recombinase XerC